MLKNLYFKNWQEIRNYSHLQNKGWLQFAWEFLRRNVRYQDAQKHWVDKLREGGFQGAIATTGEIADYALAINSEFGIDVNTSSVKRFCVTHPSIDLPPGFCDTSKRVAIFAKDFSVSLAEKSAKMTRPLLPSAAPIRPASVSLRHTLVYSMRLRNTPTNDLTPCRDALYFTFACATRADSGKTPGATAIGD